MGIDVWVHDVLSITFVGIQQSMFKLAIKSNVLDAIVKPTNSNIFTTLAHSFNYQSAFLFLFGILQIVKDCHGTSPWEYGRRALF